jgi:outer membrane protein TolC
MMLLLAGCSLHKPTEVKLSVELPQEFLEQKMTVEARPLAGQWWLAFEDEQLNQLMTELFKQNLELTQAVARLEQVEALVQITRSEESPFLSGGGNVGRSSQPSLSDDFIGNNQQLSLAAGYELDLWGKLSAQSRAAELDLWPISTTG